MFEGECWNIVFIGTALITTDHVTESTDHTTEKVNETKLHDNGIKVNKKALSYTVVRESTSRSE